MCRRLQNKRKSEEWSITMSASVRSRHQLMNEFGQEEALKVEATFKADIENAWYFHGADN